MILRDLGEDDGAGLPINALLWRASLDIVATIPLDDVDTFGGAIVTEWYQLNQNTDERIKIAIFVLDRELRSDGIRVWSMSRTKQVMSGKTAAQMLIWVSSLKNLS